MKGSKTVYICSECGYQVSKWAGKCPSCKSWNTFEEQVVTTEPPSSAKRPLSMSGTNSVNTAMSFSELDLPDYIRCGTGLGELDRVLGGGLVNGSVVLLSGEPGIGKSTLLTQICGSIIDNRVLYVSGEESRSQLKLRADRLGIKKADLYVLTETNIDRVMEEAERVKPDIMIVDSIQTIYSDQISSVPGSVTQVKESALRFINKAKSGDISIILVGHVNKEGGIAGPKVLEHMVDAVLYFEGEHQNSYRIIRAVKNRFGSTNEIGVFEMTSSGLKEIPNPSEVLLADRPKNVSGNCAVCVMEGSRPVIAEIQALVATTVFPAPRRTSNGIDYNRMCLLLAVLEKRLGLKFYNQDVYLNVIGGLRLEEPAADLAVALAMISGLRDKPVSDDIIAIGEVGLSGECRAVSNAELRIKEAVRLGFTRIILPKRSAEKLTGSFGDEAEIIPVKSVYEVLSLRQLFEQ